ncbi:MAG: urea transporter [Leptolyngbyaceae cyanobacterium MO_188.B28]|nr:urea transporter [Leptolyngbyaceae cyanobacterium MO_188.B28]
MGNQSFEAVSAEPTPLHELISRILVAESPPPVRFNRLLSTAGTLQGLNQRLEKQPLANFLNYTLRGIGQVIFVNNPISGALILLALFIQSSWLGLMGLAGVLASTLTALMLGVDREPLRNGIFGYNGLLAGAALATFSAPSIGAGVWGWAIAAIFFAALTTVMMKFLGVWWAKTVNTPPLHLPFCIATLICLALALWIPQPWLHMGTAATTAPAPALEGLRLATALPIGVGQVFLASKLISGGLILLAVSICTPLGALVGLLGGGLGILASLLTGQDLNALYAGLWGYNAVLCAMAIGGVFYAPNLRSIGIGAIAAFLSALLGGALSQMFGMVGLPALTLPFCLVALAFFMGLQRSLPSLVPVALHAVTSPEEHRQRYQVAKDIISNFRLHVAAALFKKRHFYLFDGASTAIKGDLRYIFNSIDTDQSGSLSTQELAAHLRDANKALSEDDLTYLFTCMDSDNNGVIDFEEFGELMLRHRRLMANYSEFVTYFLPIDANDDDVISLPEMNVAMASVGEPPLSEAESAFLVEQTKGRPLTWHRFIEMLLVI